MKKICFITTVPLTLQSFVLKTAEYIHQNTDWDISFICDYEKEFADNLPAYFHYFPVPMERGIRIAGIGSMLKMKKIFRKEKFDLIQYSTPNASLYASLAGKWSRVPVRLYCQWGMAYVGFSGVKRKIFRLEEKLVCSLSTYIEPDSKSNLEFALSEQLYSADKGAVIWKGSACGVDLKKFDIAKKEKYREKIFDEYNLPQDSFVYGFVGRITRDKGINELLAAFKKIYKGNLGVYLMLVGPTENDSTVDDDLFCWSKECDHVIYTGFTNVVEQYLSAMDVYILPSYREGFGMGVVEAEAMGLPVIVSDIPGPTDAMLSRKTGIVVNKADVDSLISAMNEILDDKDFRSRCEKNSVEFVKENFEQNELFKRILQDRKELIDYGK